MDSIRIVWGTGTGPTELAAYDAALADANLHEYNLIPLSSVIPASATIEQPGTAPDLGPIGHGLYVVEAAVTAVDREVSAVLTWARSSDGAGLFYEAAGPQSAGTIADRALTGIRAGMDRRDRTFDSPTTRTVTTSPPPGDNTATAAVAIATYGTAHSLLESPADE